METETTPADERTNENAAKDKSRQHEPGECEMPCPVCGAPMPDLKGGKSTICPNCGFKDSCCY